MFNYVPLFIERCESAYKETSHSSRDTTVKKGKYRKNNNRSVWFQSDYSVSMKISTPEYMMPGKLKRKLEMLLKRTELAKSTFSIKYKYIKQCFDDISEDGKMNCEIQKADKIIAELILLDTVDVVKIMAGESAEKLP